MNSVHKQTNYSFSILYKRYNVVFNYLYINCYIERILVQLCDYLVWRSNNMGVMGKYCDKINCFFFLWLFLYIIISFILLFQYCLLFILLNFLKIIQQKEIKSRPVLGNSSSLQPFLQPDDIHRGSYDDPTKIANNICARTCVKGQSKICYYQFTFEAYTTLGA